MISCCGRRLEWCPDCGFRKECRHAHSGAQRDDRQGGRGLQGKKGRILLELARIGTRSIREEVNTSVTTNDRTTNATPAADVDAYLATLPDDMRNALEALRQMIKAAAPEAQETISYRVPTFRYLRRPLVAFGAAKHHCAFYVMSSTVLDGYRDELRLYDTSKGTIRFTPDAPLPDTLVTKLVKARMGATEARTTNQPRGPAPS